MKTKTLIISSLVILAGALNVTAANHNVAGKGINNASQGGQSVSTVLKVGAQPFLSLSALVPNIGGGNTAPSKVVGPPAKRF